jgi:NADH-quinone oxidoreductase subunit K
MDISPLFVCWVGVCVLMGIALYGLLTARNLIKIVIMLQVFVKAAILSLVLAGHAGDQLNMSQNMAITVIVVDTIVAVVGLALAIQVQRQLGTLDVKSLSSLKG